MYLHREKAQIKRRNNTMSSPRGPNTSPSSTSPDTHLRAHQPSPTHFCHKLSANNDRAVCGSYRMPGRHKHRSLVRSLGTQLNTNRSNSSPRAVIIAVLSAPGKCTPSLLVPTVPYPIMLSFRYTYIYMYILISFWPQPVVRIYIYIYGAKCI